MIQGPPRQTPVAIMAASAIRNTDRRFFITPSIWRVAANSTLRPVNNLRPKAPLATPGSCDFLSLILINLQTPIRGQGAILAGHLSAESENHFSLSPVLHPVAAAAMAH